ncbi:hypothetical protein [Sphingomonas aerolata]|uniref:hypothetical protein n=1 Tax=Sphingomonas aerolata TaxID=185951 RepID=UPI002FE20A40
MTGGWPDAAVMVILGLYTAGAHGIMTLNDFKAVEGDRMMGLRSAAGRAGGGSRRPAGLYRHGGPAGRGDRPAGVVGHALVALLVATLLAGQLALMVRLLRDPLKNTPWYDATGTTLYVLGMLASAFGLGGVAGL